MNDLLSLDCTLSYLNEGKIVDPVTIMIESINNELDNFNRITESYGVVKEGIDLKAIGKRILEAIKALIEKFKKFAGAIKEKFLSLTKKGTVQLKKEEEKVKEEHTEEERKYTYNELVIEYNDKEYSEDDTSKLIDSLQNGLGTNHMTNIMNALRRVDDDKLEQAFEAFKEYGPHQRFNSSLHKEVKAHDNLTFSEYKKYMDSDYHTIMGNPYYKELTWASGLLDKWKTVIQNLSNGDNHDDMIRHKVANYMVGRMNQYYDIISTINGYKASVCALNIIPDEE